MAGTKIKIVIVEENPGQREEQCRLGSRSHRDCKSVGRRSSIRLSHCVSLRAVSFPTVIGIDIYEERHLSSPLTPSSRARKSHLVETIRFDSRCVIMLRIFFFFFFFFNFFRLLRNLKIVLRYFFFFCVFYG